MEYSGVGREGGQKEGERKRGGEMAGGRKEERLLERKSISWAKGKSRRERLKGPRNSVTRSKAFSKAFLRKR